MDKLNTPILLTVVTIVALALGVSFLFASLSITIDLGGAVVLLFSGCLAGFLLLNIIQRHRLDSTSILLNLGRIESKIGLLGGIFFAFISLNRVAQLFSDGLNNAGDLTRMILYGVISIFFLAFSLSEIYITEDGFSRLGGTIKWENITDYDWTGQQNNKLNLKLRNGREATFTIPYKDQDKLNKLLKTRL